MRSFEYKIGYKLYHIMLDIRIISFTNRIYFIQFHRYWIFMSKTNIMSDLEIEISLIDEFSGRVLLKYFKESSYASLMIVMYSSPNSSTIRSPIPVA